MNPQKLVILCNTVAAAGGTRLDLANTGGNRQVGDGVVFGLARAVAHDGGIAVAFCQVDRFESLVNPQRPIPRGITRLTGITDEMVSDKPPMEVVLPQFKTFVGDAVMVAHNGAFDMKFIQLKEKQAGCRFDNPLLDTLFLSVYLHNHVQDHTLDGIARRFDVDVTGRHTALGDTMVTAEIFVQMLELLKERGITKLKDAFAIEGEMESLRREQARY